METPKSPVAIPPADDLVEVKREALLCSENVSACYCLAVLFQEARGDVGDIEPMREQTLRPQRRFHQLFGA